MRIHRFLENYAIQLVEPPIAISDGVLPATYIDVAQYERFAFLRLVGVSDDTAVTMQVKQATSSAGAGAKDVTDAALTGTALAGSSEDNQWAGVEVETRKLDGGNGFRYVAVDLAATGGSSTLGSVLFIGINKTGPVGYPITQGADCAEIVYVDG